MKRIPLRDVREGVSPLGEYVLVSDEVAAALAAAQPVVALETSLITHGLPLPHCVASEETYAHLRRDMLEGAANPAG